MSIQRSYVDDKILYLVPTPIGNLDDMTFRAVAVLQSSDVIYCEDTRTSLNLLRHFSIKTKLVSLHDFNEENRINEIKKNLDQGASLSIISDAGMPNICDPGFKVIRALIEEGYKVVSLPGANALISAIAASGLNTENFSFKGFFPRKQNTAKELMLELKNLTQTVIFYESCHRINKTLEFIYKELGDINIVIAREISKKFETYYRGKISEFLKEEYKGEIVLMLELVHKDNEEDLDKLILDRLGTMKGSSLVKEIAVLTSYNKNEIYKRFIELKEREE